MKKLVVIDGNSLLFRAYFAMRPMTTKEGVFTQGVFAFINMLDRIVKESDPDYLAVAFDMKKKTFRHEIYKEYKAGRQKTPPELLSQIPLLKKVLHAMNIAVLEKETYEADDIIGTLSVKATDAGIETLIISGDKDELQLVGKNVRTLINRKGMSEFDLYDEAKMDEVYGLTPAQFIDLKALMGDSSDNIPGVPGVGEKKGIALLKEYGTLEGVIEHADEIKGKRGENVRDNIDEVRVWKKLTTIFTDVPLDVSLDDLKFEEPDCDELLKVYTELEFNSFIRALQKDGKTGGPAVKATSNADATDLSAEADAVKTVAWADFIKACEKGEELFIEAALPEDHSRVPEIKHIALLSAEKKIFTYRELTAFEYEDALGDLIKTGCSFAGHSLKPLVYTIKYYGHDDPEISFDTEIAEYLIDANAGRYDLMKMFFRYSKTAPELPEEGGEKAALCRLIAASKVMGYQKPILEDEGLAKLFYECELPLIMPLAEMEKNGMAVRKDVLEEQGRELEKNVKDLESRIYGIAGKEFNVNSPKQLGTVLFDDLAIPYPKKKTGTGRYSTSAEVLEILSPDHEIVKLVLEFRKYSKLKSTYIDGMIPLIAGDGRIHPHFQQTVTATGRLSCTAPNLQNIPTRDEYSKKIRKAFVAEDDNVLVGSDYSQIELRILAAMSGDETLIADFANGADIHRATASRVFGIPFDEVTPLDRSKAKAVNFGIIYGISDYGLSVDLGIPKWEAAEYIDEYFDKHKAVKNFLDEQIALGKKERRVRTLFGRIREIQEFSSRKYVELQLARRLAMNTPIQGTAADIMKIAMNKVYAELTKRKMKSRLLLQVHDELIIEAVKDEVEDVKKLLKTNMESAVKTAVDLTCEVSSADNWYDLK